MSMRDYAIHDYGFIIDKSLLEHFASEAFDDYTPEEYAADKWSFIDALIDKLGIEYIGEFTGEAFRVDDAGDLIGAGDTSSYCMDSVFYVPTRKYPTLVGSTYSSMEDVVSEFGERIGKYLPPGYDIRSNIRHIVGTYYG